MHSEDEYTDDLDLLLEGGHHQMRNEQAAEKNEGFITIGNRRVNT